MVPYMIIIDRTVTLYLDRDTSCMCLQVVYNTVPVWSAIMAVWMLGEGMGFFGWFGSSTLILATLILAF